jgi:hypothetical protein
MTNHHSGATTAEAIYSIVPVLAGFSADDITAEQDHAVQEADTAEHNFACQNTSDARPFERRVGLADHVAIERTIPNMMPWAAESTNQKILLPRQTGELRFSPQQYYYGASKSGVVPSWATSAGVHPA